MLSASNEISALDTLLIKCILYIDKHHIKRGEKVKIIISNNTEAPLYKQITDQIKDAILREEFKEGELLPSIRSFASDLKVSVLTIRRVYSDLEAEGFVKSQAGLGTFVSTGNMDLIRDAKYRLVEEQMKSMLRTAKQLNIERKEIEEMLKILYEED